MSKHLWPRGTVVTLDLLRTHVEVDERGCWNWLRQLNGDGYATKKIQGQMVKLHRLSWSLVNGEIPEGLVIDHLCFNRRCINPDHLRVVTKRENDLRKLSLLRPTCAHGHKWTPENTYVYPGRKKRECRTCMRDRSRRTVVKLRIQRASLSEAS